MQKVIGLILYRLTLDCIPHNCSHLLKEAMIIPVQNIVLNIFIFFPLSDLFVFGALPLSSWKEILLSLKDVLSSLHQYSSDSCNLTSLDELYLCKTLERLNEHSYTTGIAFSEKKFAFSESHDELTLFELAKKSAEFYK
ncbi:capsular polysaccharide [Escherichia coli]|nr:capsular polysaccharide [Escherichia coli]